MISMFTNCELQLDGKNLQLTKLQIYQIDPPLIHLWTLQHQAQGNINSFDGQIFTRVKPRFVTKYLVDSLILVYGMHNYEYQ